MTPEIEIGMCKVPETLWCSLPTPTTSCTSAGFKVFFKNSKEAIDICAPMSTRPLVLLPPTDTKIVFSCNGDTTFTILLALLILGLSATGCCWVLRGGTLESCTFLLLELDKLCCCGILRFPLCLSTSFAGSRIGANLHLTCDRALWFLRELWHSEAKCPILLHFKHCLFTAGQLLLNRYSLSPQKLHVQLDC